MIHLIRRAQSSDNSSLCALDPCTISNFSKAASITTWLKEEEVFLAEAEGIVVGYAVLCRGAFFGRDNLEMLMTETAHRGRGIGAALLLHIERLVKKDKLFITTNLSNHTMQRLLTRMNYTSCGFIDQLDPGDPEIVFVKKLQNKSPD